MFCRTRTTIATLCFLLAPAALANLPSPSIPHSLTPGDSIGITDVVPSAISGLDQAVLENPGAAFSGKDCERLSPFFSDTDDMHPNAFLVGYLRIICAKTEAELDQANKEMYLAISAARISPTMFFGEEVIRADGMLDALAYLRFRNTRVIASYLQLVGGGKRTYFVVIVQGREGSRQAVWRFDLSTRTQKLVHAATPRILSAGYNIQIAEDLPGLVYLMSEFGAADVPASVLTGKALFLSTLLGKSIDDDDVKSLLERAALDQNNGAYAKWLLASALLRDAKKLDPAIASRAVLLVTQAADSGLAEANALLAAISEMGIGVSKDMRARDAALKVASTAVGKPHAEYLMGHALQWLVGRPEAFNAGKKWLERAANDGDALAQHEFASQCEGTHVEKNRRKNCRVLWYEKSVAQENSESAFNLGVEYQSGKHVEQDYALAREWYSRAEALGDPDAPVNLGVLYELGLGVQRDTVKAAQFYLQAVEQGSPWGENNLSILLKKGDGVEKNPVEAVRWARLSAWQGNLNGMFSWGEALKNGEGVAADSKLAFDVFLNAAIYGHVVAMDRVALMYQYGTGVTANLASAAKWYERATLKGNADAMNRLGWMLFIGEGRPKDQATALTYFQKNADSGDSEGMRSLGYALLYRDSNPDLTQGMSWLTRAAEAGSSSAMNNLAWAYMNRKTVPIDLPLSKQWFEKAAIAGDLDSMINLGYDYENGQGTEKDDAQAVAWFKRAADQGNMEGLNNYAHHLLTGTGVKQDLVQAQKLFEMAVAQGDAYAKCNLGRMLHDPDFKGKDDARAWSLVVESADAGNSICQTIVGLGILYGYPDVKFDWDKAHHYLQMAATQGDEAAAAEVAVVILNTQQSDAEQMASAYKTLESLAEKGVLRAQFLFAEECMVGRAGSIDLARARTGFAQIAAQDTQFTSIAADVLGDMMVAGLGGSKDLLGAEYWYRHAVASGTNEGSVYHLGNLLLHLGRSKEAFVFLEKSAAKEHLVAQYRIARYCRENSNCPLAAKLREAYNANTSKLSAGQKNNYAWTIAADPLSDVTDGRFCAKLLDTIGLAEGERANSLDSSAACRARAGDFENAAVTQRQALEKLAADTKPSVRRGFEVRLSLYEKHQTWDGPN